MGEGGAAARLRRHRRPGGEELAARSRRRLEGRTVAVTGAGGFIGSHVVPRLLACGAHVRLLGPTPMRRPEVLSLVEGAKVDYVSSALDRDRTALSDVLADCDSLVHLNYRPPQSEGFWSRLEEEVRINLLETVGLAAAAEMAGVEQICFASSALVYRPPIEGAAEDGPVGGAVTPYALVKLEQESWLRQWALRSGRPVALLRLTTVYGPGETVGRAIPNFIRAVLSGEQPVVNGERGARFDPVHVDDVVEAIVCALASHADGTFNIGTGRAWSPRQVADLVSRQCRPDIDLSERAREPRPVTPVVDVSRAEAVLGFKAAITLRAGLGDEIRWLRASRLRWSA